MNSDQLKFTQNVKEKYNIDVLDIQKYTHRTIILNGSNGVYLLKFTNPDVEQKYEFLSNIGISNILYPLLNNEKSYLSKGDNTYFLTNFVNNSNTLIPEVKAQTLFNDLNYIHQKTSFKRQLSPMTSRPKFEEITKQLDYKFTLLEQFIRSVETRPLEVFSIPILSNYHYILDAKFELVKLEKKIIQIIKDRESVEFSFVHNNPQLEHLVINRGERYITSIDKGKIGISSLDMAKLYIENDDLNLDFRAMFKEYFSMKETDFYFEYFKFLVLFIYIKRITITGLDYTSSQSFISSAQNIVKYFHNFKDEQNATNDTN